MHALVVDDSKAVRSILSRMLRELDFAVDEACDGRDALDQIDQGVAFDLVTLNLEMPRIGGLEFLKSLRNDARFRFVPVVVVSGDASQDAVGSALDAGANGFLPKPVMRSDLLDQLKRLGVMPSLKKEPASVQKTQPVKASALTKIAVATLGVPAVPVTPGAPATPGARSIGVMVVDDSVVVRGVVTRMIEADPELHVAASASDGRVAIQKLQTCQVDVVLLDIEMPHMDGFETIKAIRRTHDRLPIIMFSSLTSQGAKVTLDAMLLGATDFAPKPGGQYMGDVDAGKDTIEHVLIPKIKQFAKGSAAGGIASVKSHPSTPASIKINRGIRSGKPRIVAIGVSTGGPQTLAELLPAFVPQCPVPIVIVQHMPATFTSYLAQRLRDGYRLPIHEAIHDQKLQSGHVYLAPGGRHMRVVSFGSENRIAINDDPPENACRPSVDVLFQSVQKTFGSDSLAVMLTGMGNDGLRGTRAIHDCGGYVIAQDQSSSVVWGMPGSVVRAGLADKVLPLSDIAREVLLNARLGSRKTI